MKMPEALTFVFLGAGVLPVGLVWLLATHTRWGRTLASQLTLAAVAGAGALALLPLWPLLSLAVGVSGVLMLGLAVLRSPLPGQLLQLSARPMGQAGLLTLIGVGLMGYGFYRIEADLSDHLAESDQLFQSLTREVDFNPSPSLMVQTDRGTTVELWTPTSDSIEDLQSFSEQEYLRRMHLEASLIQTGPADGDYNCHGWVFTGGRSWIRGQSVEAILQDNGYRETKRPMIGDLCIYRDNRGEVAHSAIVRGLGEKGVVLLESKWGKLGRYIHMAHENHAYTGHDHRYYRSSRSGGHLLRGLPAVEQAVSDDLLEE
jgi:hypothetical protein